MDIRKLILIVLLNVLKLSTLTARVKWSQSVVSDLGQGHCLGRSILKLTGELYVMLRSEFLRWQSKNKLTGFNLKRKSFQTMPRLWQVAKSWGLPYH